MAKWQRTPARSRRRRIRFAQGIQGSEFFKVPDEAGGEFSVFRYGCFDGLLRLLDFSIVFNFCSGNKIGDVVF